jgi:hypothetical protein
LDARREELPPAYAGHVVGGASPEAAQRNRSGGRDKPAKGTRTTSSRARQSGKAGAPVSTAKSDPPQGAKPDRLKAGGLEPMVLDYLAQNADSGPHSPAAVAKAINRSSGAVANCLKRLAASD